MIIVEKDNKDRDYYVESIVAKGLSVYYGKLIADFLNKRAGENADDYYVVEPDHYTPKENPFEP